MHAKESLKFIRSLIRYPYIDSVQFTWNSCGFIRYEVYFISSLSTAPL